MKTTGVVRRVDDLGRIVIPKEIRRTLRIRDGESLEIYVDDETISLKKYSSMNDLSDISKELVNTINQNLLKDAFISDRDKIISISGNAKNKYLGKNISKFIYQKIDDREIVIEKNFAEVEFADGVKEKYSYINAVIHNSDFKEAREILRKINFKKSIKYYRTAAILYIINELKVLRQIINRRFKCQNVE